MEDEECIHGLGERAWCTICNGKDEKERAIAWNIVAKFKAKYDGTCSNCSTGILVGDYVALTEARGVICSDCFT